jgi:RimJ/RimL family protein N-acetyltransferase
MNLTTPLFTGELVRLAQDEPETWAAAWRRWNSDSLLHRLMDDQPPQLFSANKHKQRAEADLEPLPTSFTFTIHRLDDDRLIGFIDLAAISFQHGEGWVGMAIGERDCWGQGYGTDALRLVLRYAFQELDLHRVSLGVFANNPRAIRSYEKAGFRFEGIERQATIREGAYYDTFYMGVLRSEWLALQAGSVQPTPEGVHA